MKRFLNGLDARTIGAVALLLIVLLAGWQVAWQRETVQQKDAQISALVRTSEAKDVAAERAATAAAAAASDSAANQAALLAYTKALADRQTSLLTWLRRNGIDLPVRYLSEITPPKIVREPAPKSSKKRSTPRRPDLPGKSERGQRKGKGKR